MTFFFWISVEYIFSYEHSLRKNGDTSENPKINKNSVQIEVNRKLYMDEITRIKSDNFDLLKTNIGSLLIEIKLQIEKGIL